MSSREDILQSIRRATHVKYEKPDLKPLEDMAMTYPSKVEQIGVAENGAVWIEQDVKQRAIYFIAEKLVILLDKNKIVNNMHEAYKLIDTGEYGFGTFISGPSKTADIEQALVMGAHGARDVTVVLI